MAARPDSTMRHRHCEERVVMRSDHGYGKQRNANGGARAAAAAWGGAWPLPAATLSNCPPVIEEWLSASRARLLRRYGGIDASSRARRGR
jgi:hypothetical protein